jgi:prepilin-type N-terminal cleavage/methylation domain-containing protein
MRNNNDKGFTLIEVLISLIICVILFAGSMSYTYQQRADQIDERIAKKAISQITSECEYWQTKITTKKITDRDWQGYTNNPYKSVVLDSSRNIVGDLYLSPINPVDMVETTTSPDFFEIIVTMKWVDVDSQFNTEKLEAVVINPI